MIPKGDWYCSECRPPEPAPKVVRKRTAPKYLSDDDIADELEEDSDSDGDDNPRTNRGTKKSANGEADDEVCEICGLGGQVMCCDNCPKLYHLLCLDPPKTRVPRGTWYCPACKGNKSLSKTAKKHVKSKAKKRPTKKRRIIESSDEESESEDQSEEENESSREMSEEETNNAESEGSCDI